MICAVALLLDLPANTTFRFSLIICSRLSLTRHLDPSDKLLPVPAVRPQAHFRHLHFSSCAALVLVPSPKRTQAANDPRANDSIPAEPLSLHYASIDNTINIIMSCPQPVYLSKLDVRSAFQQIPVRRQDFAGKPPSTKCAFCLSASAPVQPSLTQ